MGCFIYYYNKFLKLISEFYIYNTIQNMITKSQKIANEEHFSFHMKIIKSGGFYFWIDKQEKMYVFDNKFHLTPLQTYYVSQIVRPQWLKNNVVSIVAQE